MKKITFGTLFLLMMMSISCAKPAQPTAVSPVETPYLSAESPLSVPVAMGFTESRILFISNRDGAEHWYSMLPDGSEVQRLDLAHMDATEYREMMWVPALNVFVVLLSVEGSEDLYLVDRVCKFMQRLTTTVDGEGGAIYSIAGDKFAFVCVHQDLDICLVSSNGEDHINATAYPSRESSPDWSPDGKKIAFVSNRDAIPDIWVVNNDGTDLTNLTQTGQPDGEPDWSLDGSKILFSSQRDFNWEIYVMDADGKNPLNLSNNTTAVDVSPRWSPDGQYIAFLSNRNGDQEIYVMTIEGKGVTNISNSPETDEYVFIWSTDSQKLLYVSFREGNADIYVVNRDGTGVVNLTTHEADDYAPQWVGN
ncbi:MAG: hypothetical protein K8R89_03085 [Anaerolineae bacterium]|nr:hypothetical protein [Anaerolineae bacterium]